MAAVAQQPVSVAIEADQVSLGHASDVTCRAILAGRVSRSLHTSPPRQYIFLFSSTELSLGENAKPWPFRRTVFIAVQSTSSNILEPCTLLRIDTILY